MVVFCGVWVYCGDCFICMVKLYKIFDFVYCLLIVVKFYVVICKLFGGL